MQKNSSQADEEYFTTKADTECSQSLKTASCHIIHGNRNTNEHICKLFGSFDGFVETLRAEPRAVATGSVDFPRSTTVVHENIFGWISVFT